MTLIFLALAVSVSLDLADVPFELNESCYPFHYSLGQTHIKLNDGA
jgi:hypothetical protein